MAEHDLELALEQACQKDIRPLMEQFFIIRDEKEAYVPFVYNTVQAHYSAAVRTRNIIVKPRKVGFSTQWIAEQVAMMLVTPGYQALAFTYDEDEAEYLFGIARRIYDSLPAGTQPHLGKDSGRAMSIPSLDSSLEIYSSGGRRKGRGRTPSSILLDEFAQYDDNVAVDIFTAVVNSAPLWVPVTILSTPRGIGNEFHRQFVRAEAGETPFKAHFYPWMWLGEKHQIAIDSPLVADKSWLQGELEYTEEELGLIESWNSQHSDMPIGQDHIRWRRYKHAEDSFGAKQEYPEDSVSCFLATTDALFDSDVIGQAMQSTRPPMHTEMNGKLKVWRRPVSGMAYCVGVDCGEGIPGRDNSVAVFGDMYGQVVAVLCGIIDQAEMAQLVYDMAKEYHGAFVLNERQGAFTFQRDLHNMGYKNIYRHDEAGMEGRRRKTVSQTPLGFPMSTSSKGTLIAGMRNALKSRGFLCPDIETMREIMEYQRHRDGTYGAPVGSHDDRAMASMLYLRALEECIRVPQRVKRDIGSAEGNGGMVRFREGLFA